MWNNSRVARLVTEHLSKQTKKAPRWGLGSSYSPKRFCCYRHIHNHLDCIKWCRIEKDMPLQNRGPVKTRKSPKQTHGNLSSSIKFLINGQHVTCVQTRCVPKLSYFSSKKGQEVVESLWSLVTVAQQVGESLCSLVITV